MQDMASVTLHYAIVALRKESVDRNVNVVSFWMSWLSSLSARRAWIEMPEGSRPSKRCASLSARRAWIEISAWGRRGTASECVALRKESVDRNLTFLFRLM